MENMSIRIYFSPTQYDTFDEVKKAVAEKTPLLIKYGVKDENDLMWKWLTIFWDEEPGLHSGTAIRWNDESDIDDFIDYLTKIFDLPRVDNFPKMEKQALSNCIDYINRCENKTEGGYKECVRDAFTPFVQKYPRQKDTIGAVDQYYLDIIDGVDYVNQAILDGVKSGLRSVYTA